MKKKFLFKLLLLIVLVALTVTIIGNQDNNIYRKKSIDLNIARVKESFYEDSLSILFLGSSHTYSGIRPFIFDSAGYKSYVLATGSAGPCTIQLIWDDYVKDHVYIPRVAAVDIHPSIFTAHTDNFYDYPVHRYLNSPLSNERLAFNFNLGLKCYLRLKYKSFLNGFTQLWNNTDTALVERAISNMQLNRGFESVELNEADYKAKLMVATGYKTEVFDSQKADQYYALINSIKAKGVNVVVEEIPHNIENSFFSKDFLNAYNAFLQKVKTMEGVYVVSAANDFDRSNLYRDMDHLNETGATKYTYWLLDNLQTNHILQKKITR